MLRFTPSRSYFSAVADKRPSERLVAQLVCKCCGAVISEGRSTVATNALASAIEKLGFDDKRELDLLVEAHVERG